ncbi:MAG: PilT/PilU family type 4a pilus ATPase [Clostridia bacterium]|nr:PilT/PilU family type 4a pilus ATPase [Clostridia bacterium]
MILEEILKNAIAKNASDIFLVAGYPVGFKIDGCLIKQSDETLKPEHTLEYVKGIYDLANRGEMERHIEEGDDDFSFSLPGEGRFRVNLYKQRGSLAVIMRVVHFDLPDYKKLGIPESVMDLGKKTGGLVLVTGPAGSGKSTTLACLIDRINKTREGHIMTLEDPIEFLHRHNRCIVSQREISIDTQDYVTGLKSALRQSPDVIFIGEMRDAETINIAITAAETGHLVLSTLHTLGAANAIDRIIDAFPPNQQNQVRVQLSMVLQAVVSQQLVQGKDGGRVPAFEVMTATNAVRNLIRESKMHQLESIMHSGMAQGMKTMDSSLTELYRQGKITRENALTHSFNFDAMARMVG